MYKRKRIVTHSFPSCSRAASTLCSFSLSISPSRLPLASPLLRRSLIYSPSEFFTVPTFTSPASADFVRPKRTRTSFQFASRTRCITGPPFRPPSSLLQYDQPRTLWIIESTHVCALPQEEPPLQQWKCSTVIKFSLLYSTSVNLAG